MNGAPAGQPGPEPYLRIRDLSRRFGDFEAVKHVTLDVYKGEIFCLLGGSGCGKTTLLRLLAGFDTPSSGEILIDAENMAGIPPYRRPVNMMFQSYALFPHMSVERNVAFGLEQEHIARREVRRRVGEILQVVKMSSYLKRKPHQLSGGQRQRVALARALIKRPKVLLLDEPLAALDRKLREHTQFELLNIQKELGVTFIVVTHDQEEAMTLASRIGVMDRGEIVQVGAPKDIYEHPSSRFVAEFIGSVNLFEGRLIERGAGRVRVQCEELPAPVLVDRDYDAPVGANVWVAVRPERAALHRESPRGTDNWTSGTLRQIAYMGDLSVFIIALDSGHEFRVTEANSSAYSVGQFKSGERTFVSWDAHSVVIGARP